MGALSDRKGKEARNKLAIIVTIFKSLGSKIVKPFLQTTETVETAQIIWDHVNGQQQVITISSYFRL